MNDRFQARVFGRSLLAHQPLERGPEGRVADHVTMTSDISTSSNTMVRPGLMILHKSKAKQQLYAIAIFREILAISSPSHLRLDSLGMNKRKCSYLTFSLRSPTYLLE